MKTFLYSLISVALLFSTIFFPGSRLLAQEETPQHDPNATLFISHLQEHWDDLHDVIMRFHMDDPGLKGVVFIDMEWTDGSLAMAVADSNTTGNEAFGTALTEAMAAWKIEGMSGAWMATVPVRTAIVCSDDPAFDRCGILTGKVTDASGNPISLAEMNLVNDQDEYEPISIRANREGIFIKTLIPPGSWTLECMDDGFGAESARKLYFTGGEHIKIFLSPAAP